MREIKNKITEPIFWSKLLVAPENSGLLYWHLKTVNCFIGINAIVSHCEQQHNVSNVCLFETWSCLCLSGMNFD